MAIARDFQLIRSESAPEKRVLPRFPFCFLTFKSEQSNQGHAFEVNDISPTGMQIRLRDGDHGLKKDHEIVGTLHWHGRELKVKGIVAWRTSSRVGISFDSSDKFQSGLGDYLELSNLKKYLRPVHKSDLVLEWPRNLSYWLRADGPVELFVWQHRDQEYSEFQVVVYENFIEWKDGEGVRTGRVLTKRDLETPLITEDEFIFDFDENLNYERLDKAQELVSLLESQHLPQNVLDFLRMKLSH